LNGSLSKERQISIEESKNMNQEIITLKQEKKYLSEASKSLQETNKKIIEELKEAYVGNIKTKYGKD
jgi:hypothetical protein